MTSPSAIINKHLRKVVSPALRDGGFDHVDARNGWAWFENIIWVFNIRAVGLSFSQVTGWPPSSVGVWLGIFFGFIPSRRPDLEIKTDNKGHLLPAEGMCHIRSHLERNLKQNRLIRDLSNPGEQRRRDIWWLAPDGQNAQEVAEDIASVLIRYGLPWFVKNSDLRFALSEIEAERGCYLKYYRALHLARFIGDEALERKYTALEEKERVRIGINEPYRDIGNKIFSQHR